jgi:hypothetical protein
MASNAFFRRKLGLNSAKATLAGSATIEEPGHPFDANVGRWSANGTVGASIPRRHTWRERESGFVARYVIHSAISPAGGPLSQYRLGYFGHIRERLHMRITLGPAIAGPSGARGPPLDPMEQLRNRGPACRYRETGCESVISERLLSGCPSRGSQFRPTFNASQRGQGGRRGSANPSDIVPPFRLIYCDTRASYRRTESGTRRPIAQNYRHRDTRHGECHSSVALFYLSRFGLGRRRRGGRAKWRWA